MQWIPYTISGSSSKALGYKIQYIEVSQVACNDNRESVMLGMAPLGHNVLNVKDQRVVVWPTLLTHQLEDVMF
jgi:hypothetical protein